VRSLLAAHGTRLPFVATAALGLVLLVLAVQLGTGSVDGPGPGMFPALAAGLLLVSSLATTVTGTRADDSSSGTGHPAAGGGVEPDGPTDAGMAAPPDADAAAGAAQAPGRPLARIATVLAVPLVYVAVVGALGHALAAACGAALVVRVLGRRRWRVVTAIALAIGFGSDLLVRGVLGVSLPVGPVPAPWP